MTRIDMSAGGHRRIRRVWPILVLTAALPGCGTLAGLFGSPPSPETQAEIEQMADLLGRFEAAVQQDNADAIVALLSPVLVEGSSQDIEADIRLALYSWRYSDYRLYYREALRDLRDDPVESGRVVLKIRYRTNTGGHEKDRFVLRRFKGKWAIGDPHMIVPEPGESLDMTQDERDQILSKVEVCIDALKEGTDGYGKFIVAMEGKQKYAPLTSQPARNDYNEWVCGVQLLFESVLSGINFSRERTRVLHDCTDQVAVLVPMGMKYPPTSDGEFKQITLTFLVANKGEAGWQIVDLMSSRKVSLASRLKRMFKSE